MEKRMQRNVAAGAAALLAVAGGGAAIAATQDSPKQESQAVLNDAASRLGVKPSELSAALKSALKKRVDATVAAGRITNAQGDELKQRIDSNDFPLFGFGGPRGFERHGDGKLPEPGFRHGFGFRHHNGPTSFEGAVD